MKKAKNIVEFFDIIRKDGCVSFDTVKYYKEQEYKNEHKAYLIHKDGQKERGYATILEEHGYSSGGIFSECIGVADMKKGILYVYNFTFDSDSKFLGGFSGSLKAIEDLSREFNAAVEREVYNLIDEMEEEELAEYAAAFGQHCSVDSIRKDADNSAKRIILSTNPAKDLNFPDFTEDVTTPEHYTVWEHSLENGLSAGDVAKMIFEKKEGEEKQMYHYIYWYFLKNAYENWKERPDAEELTVIKTLMKNIAGTKNLKVRFSDGCEESIETSRIENAILNDYSIYRKDHASSYFRDITEITYAKKVLYHKEAANA